MGSPAERPTPIGNVKATRDDWLDLALSVLAAEGVERVTVLNLSERRAVSRSSFYWYFKKSPTSCSTPCSTAGTVSIRARS